MVTVTVHLGKSILVFSQMLDVRMRENTELVKKRVSKGGVGEGKDD